MANFVDAGTSIWLHRQVGAQFDAEALARGGGPVLVPAGSAPQTHEFSMTEGLQVHRPGTLSQVAELSELFQAHSNQQRPSPRALVWQPTTSGGLPNVPHPQEPPRDGGS
jgi:hypothetical protein